jgi:Lar family restriction alleviation protein
MSTGDSIDLLPCPFCGGSAVEIIDNRVENLPRVRYAVRHVCNPTNATVGLFCQTSWFETREAAAELWNTRKL